MHPAIQLLIEMRQAMIQQIFDSIPNKVQPSMTQVEALAKIRAASGVAVVQDKGTAFAVLGPKMQGCGGVFISRQKNPRFAVDVVVLNEDANVPYWYSTLFHELAHATGTADKLNRQGISGQVDALIYSFEELVAESVARRIMERLELATDETRNKSAKYIEQYATPMQYLIDTDKLQNEVEAAERMVMTWIEGIDFKNIQKIA